MHRKDAVKTGDLMSLGGSQNRLLSKMVKNNCRVRRAISKC